MTEPLCTSAVKQLVRAILAGGKLHFSGHALKEMEIDNLKMTDIRAAIRAGRVFPGELENGSYRYRIMTSRIAAVLAFRDENWAVVVTAWRCHD